MDVIKIDFDLEKNILTRKAYEEANLLMYIECTFNHVCINLCSYYVLYNVGISSIRISARFMAASSGSLAFPFSLNTVQEAVSRAYSFARISSLTGSSSYRLP